ncbi:MAG: DUF3592 domain-containing protein [Anaerolineales bacterium]|nr:DUF3592 domain-containing protein [Anaerolineales bacterium]
MNVVVIGLAVVGVLLIGYTVMTGYVAVQSRGWPVVNGRITQSEMTMSREYGRSLWSGQIQLHFAYVYEVDGEPLTGSRVWLGNTAVLQKFTIQRILSAYPPDAVVPVAYSPGRPALALLEPGLHWPILVPVVVGLLLILPLVWTMIQ